MLFVNKHKHMLCQQLIVIEYMSKRSDLKFNVAGYSIVNYELLIFKIILVRSKFVNIDLFNLIDHERSNHL